MSDRGALALIMFAGAGYLVWKHEQAAAAPPMAGGAAASGSWSNGSAMQTYEQMLAEQQANQQQQTGGQMGFNFAPLLGWVLGKIGSGGNGSTQGNNSGGGGVIVDSWDGSNSGATTTDTGASAGGSAGGYTGGGSLNVRSILDLIGSAEAPQGYDQVYGGSKLSPPRPITTMTVGEVLDWQKRSVAAGSYSSAAGRYQVINKTLAQQVRNGTVSLNDTYDAATQDKIALSLMEGRGLNRYQSGQISTEQFAQNLSQEWAGLPAIFRDRKGRTATGQSYYADDGVNKATVSTSSVLNALRQSLGSWV